MLSCDVHRHLLLLLEHPHETATTGLVVLLVARSAIDLLHACCYAVAPISCHNLIYLVFVASSALIPQREQNRI